MKILRALMGRARAARRGSSQAGPRSALLVTSDPALLDRLRRLVAAAGLDPVHVAGAEAALELSEAAEHPLVVVEAPVPGMGLEGFVEALREHRRRRQGGLLVLTTSEHRPAAQSALRGSGTVLVRHAPDELLGAVISRLASAAPRRRPHGVVTARILPDAASSPLVCPVVNLSSTGVLVLTQRVFPVGTRCQVELTEEASGEAVAAEGWIVRHQPPQDATDSIHDRMAIQFLDGASPGHDRLTGFLERV